MREKKERQGRDYPELCIADRCGKVYNVPLLAAAGMKAGFCSPLRPSQLIKLPCGSPLFMLPGRAPVGFDPDNGEVVRLKDNPFHRGAEPCSAVAAFLAPGYSVTENCAYEEPARNSLLPLFAYAAVAFYRGEFYAAGVRVDRERRQDIRFMDLSLVKKNTGKFQKLLPRNRLVKHLVSCALVNQCPAARNFFLQRYEGPLPTSPSCNAQCAGCLSLQPEGSCPVTQPRITFVPTPEEIAEVALWHIDNVRDPVVSFGQGCEGEPLLAGTAIEQAIKIIRQHTRKGIINLNTNASLPRVLERLFDVGLDSIRVSLNSLQPRYYQRYYRPKGYTFSDVLASIQLARKRGIFVSINYLTLPGFTDSAQEYEALYAFLKDVPVRMIQWRNLNYDPRAYFRLLKTHPKPEKCLGMRKVIARTHRDFPGVMKGYFNPSRDRMRRHSREK